MLKGHDVTVKACWTEWPLPSFHPGFPVVFLKDRLKDFYKDVKQTSLHQVFVLKFHLEYIFSFTRATLEWSLGIFPCFLNARVIQCLVLRLPLPGFTGHEGNSLSSAYQRDPSTKPDREPNFHILKDHQARGKFLPAESLGNSWSDWIVCLHSSPTARTGRPALWMPGLRL